MADTLANIKLTANTWVDLYALSGIAVGAQINTKILAGDQVWFVAQAAEPTAPPSGYRNYTEGDEVVNDVGDLGAWAWANLKDAIINVKEV